MLTGTWSKTCQCGKDQAVVRLGLGFTRSPSVRRVQLKPAFGVQGYIAFGLVPGLVTAKSGDRQVTATDPSHPFKCQRRTLVSWPPLPEAR